MRTLRVGIASYEAIKAWTMGVAEGAQLVDDSTPRIWFVSIESFARVLSTHNQALLELIRREEPKSLAELETLSGRARSNLSRTLTRMARYGLVELERSKAGRVVPRVPFDRIELDLDLARSPTASAA